MMSQAPLPVVTEVKYFGNLRNTKFSYFSLGKMVAVEISSVIPVLSGTGCLTIPFLPWKDMLTLICFQVET